jgi:hypothetical protein
MEKFDENLKEFRKKRSEDMREDLELYLRIFGEILECVR